MRVTGILVLIVVNAVIGAGPAPLSLAQIYNKSTMVEDDALSTRLLVLHNQERSQAGLSPLKDNPILREAAREHAQDMAAQQQLTHEGSDGSTPSQRVERRGYHYSRFGENVAAGQQSAQEVMQSWLQSSSHRQNILGDFNEMGAARALDAHGLPYWCVVFGSPLQVRSSSTPTHQ